MGASTTGPDATSKTGAGGVSSAFLKGLSATKVCLGWAFGCSCDGVFLLPFQFFSFYFTEGASKKIILLQSVKPFEN